VKARRKEAIRNKERHRWEDGIRTGVREIGWEGGMEWIQLAQDRGRWRAPVNTATCLQVLAPQS
jgi:hypothetical protein